MKHYILKEIVENFKNFKTIGFISRVNDTIIKLEFNRDNIYYIDLTKGKSLIYRRDKYLSTKIYNAPFDIVLKKYFIKSTIEDIYLLNNDKIIRIDIINKSSYKFIKISLQLEFTGRNTNAIILDKDNIILEALRHIDIDTSFREIKPNKKLLDIPKRNFKFEEKEIKNIDKFLYEVYQKELNNRLNGIKSQKLITINKKFQKLEKIFNSLENEDELIQKSEYITLKANIILANLHLIKNYQKEIILKDFEGNDIKIIFPKNAKSVTNSVNIFFDNAKKFKQKSKNIHIERENLSAKINFFKRLSDLIKTSKSIDEINFYYPKQKRVKKEKKFADFEIFFVDEYKILIGRNQKENIKILKLAKANDIWMHLKDRPSSHIIIQTNKKNLPKRVLEIGAKLCVDFSVEYSGNYLVDYTTRKDVKIQNGANVLYYNYKTIGVFKD